MTPAIIDMAFDVDADTVVYGPDTNVKPEALSEVLEGYIRTQIGLGKDDRESDERPVYHVRIELDLSDDSFRVVHDCGNDALCLGIVLNIFNRLP